MLQLTAKEKAQKTKSKEVDHRHEAVQGRSKLILGTVAASTGTRKRHNSKDQFISIYKKHCLGHATQKDRKTARLKKTLLEPGTSQAPLIRQQELVMGLSSLQLSLFLLLAVLFQFYSLLLTPASSIFSSVLHVFLVGVLKIWLKGMPTSALLNAKVKKILISSHFVCLLFYFGKFQNIVLFLKIKVINLLMFLLYLYLLKFLLIIQFFDKFI